MKDNLFALKRDRIFSNGLNSAMPITDCDSVRDDLWVTPILQPSGTAVHSALRLTFDYAGRNGISAGTGSLTLLTKIPQIFLSLKNGWNSSEWVFDYMKKKCSCIITYNGIGEPLHSDVQIGICSVECYEYSRNCEMTVEYISDDGKTTGDTLSFRKVPTIIRIQHFTPKKFRADMSFKPSFKYSVSSSPKPTGSLSSLKQSRVSISFGKPSIILSRYVMENGERKYKSGFSLKGGDTYSEKESICELTHKISDTLIYELCAEVSEEFCDYNPNTREYILGTMIHKDTAIVEVKMMRPKVNRIEATVLSDNRIKFEYDTSYVSSLWIDGENVSDIEHGEKILPQSSDRVNIFCYGYGQYISTVLHFPYVSDELMIRVRSDLIFDEKSGSNSLNLEWTVIGAEKVILIEDGSKKELSHIGFKTINSAEKKLELQIEKIGLIHRINLFEPEFESVCHDKNEIIKRKLERLITFFEPLYELINKQSSSSGICMNKASGVEIWARKRRQYYIQDAVEILGYSDFFYGNDKISQTTDQRYVDSECIKCGNFGKCLGSNRLKPYQCAVLLYLSYRMFIKQCDYFAKIKQIAGDLSAYHYESFGKEVEKIELVPISTRSEDIMIGVSKIIKLTNSFIKNNFSSPHVAVMGELAKQLDQMSVLYVSREKLIKDKLRTVALISAFEKTQYIEFFRRTTDMDKTKYRLNIKDKTIDQKKLLPNKLLGEEFTGTELLSFLNCYYKSKVNLIDKNNPL